MSSAAVLLEEVGKAICLPGSYVLRKALSA
jgi:hypothetical protein